MTDVSGLTTFLRDYKVVLDGEGSILSLDALLEESNRCAQLSQILWESRMQQECHGVYSHRIQENVRVIVSGKQGGSSEGFTEEEPNEEPSHAGWSPMQSVFSAPNSIRGDGGSTAGAPSRAGALGASSSTQTLSFGAFPEGGADEKAAPRPAEEKAPAGKLTRDASAAKVGSSLTRDASAAKVGSSLTRDASVAKVGSNLTRDASQGTTFSYGGTSTTSTFRPPPAAVTRGEPPGQSAVEQTLVFDVPRHILKEADYFRNYFRKERAEGRSGPFQQECLVRRWPRNFELIVTLLTLRWLLRLQVTLEGLDHKRLTMRRFLVGLMRLMTSTYEPKTLTPILARVMDHFRTRFGTAWPGFVSYVSKHTNNMKDQHQRYEISGGPPHWKGAMTLRPNDWLWQITTDIFVAAVVQTDLKYHTYQDLLADMHFYGIERPQLLGTFDGIRNWLQEVNARQRLSCRAQREAHHLALYMEAPPLQETEVGELFQMALKVAGHQNTFPQGLRARILALFLPNCRVPSGQIWSAQQRAKMQWTSSENLDLPELGFKEVGRMADLYMERLTAKGQNYVYPTTEVGGGARVYNPPTFKRENLDAFDRGMRRGPDGNLDSELVQSVSRNRDRHDGILGDKYLKLLSKDPMQTRRNEISLPGKVSGSLSARGALEGNNHGALATQRSRLSNLGKAVVGPAPRAPHAWKTTEVRRSHLYNLPRHG